MAAVITSLVAFTTGIRLATLQTVSLGGSRVLLRKEEQRGEEQRSDDEGDINWRGECAETRGNGGDSSYEKAGDVNGKEQRSFQLAKLSDAVDIIKAVDMTMPALSLRSSTTGSSEKDGVSSRNGATRVRFNLGLITEHEVTPYSEVYGGGLHPRKFHFARGARIAQAPLTDAFEIVPVCKKSGRRIRADSEESDDEDDEDCVDWKDHGRLLGGSLQRHAAHLPWPVWMVSCVLFVLLRAVGGELCQEALLMAKSIA